MDNPHYEHDNGERQHISVAVNYNGNLQLNTHNNDVTCEYILKDYMCKIIILVIKLNNYIKYNILILF